MKDNGKLVTNSKAKAEILVDQFQSVFTKESHLPEQDRPFVQRNSATISDITITVEGVCKLLKNISPAKASGPDRIPNIVLKTCAECIAPGLTIIFQKSLDTGNLPKDWLTANISCVYKKSDKHLAEK